MPPAAHAQRLELMSHRRHGFTPAGTRARLRRTTSGRSRMRVQRVRRACRRAESVGTHSLYRRLSASSDIDFGARAQDVIRQQNE